MKLLFILLIISFFSSAHAGLADSILYIGADMELKPSQYDIEGFENNTFIYSKEHSLILRGYDVVASEKKISNVVLFLGGNGFNYYSGDVIQYNLNKDFGEKKIALYTLQYPGYSGNELPMNEKTFTKAGVKALEYLRSSFPDSKITIWGHSLGAGVAAQVAATLRNKESYDFIVLSAGWISFSKLCSDTAGMLSFMCPKNSYNTNKVLSSIGSPGLLIHGANDDVIPVAHFQANKSQLKDSAFDVRLVNSKHNDLIEKFLIMIGEEILNF